MIKILKWELLKELNILKWIFISLLVFLFALSIAPINNKSEIDSTYDIFLFFSSVIIFIISIFFTVLYPSITLVLELRQSYSVLEKSIPQPFIKILIIRIIINLFIFLLGLGIGFIGMKVMNRFSIDHMPYMHFSLGLPFLYLLLCLTIFYPLIIQFFYLLSFNIPILKIYPLIGTIILTVLFIKILMPLAESLPNIALISFQILITIIAFVFSCLLYEKYYSPK